MAGTPREKGHGAVSGRDWEQDRGRASGKDKSQQCQRRRGDRSRDPKLEGQPVQRSSVRNPRLDWAPETALLMGSCPKDAMDGNLSTSGPCPQPASSQTGMT